MFTVNFLANQSITEEEINGIGYNLANTVYTSFEKNAPYGISDFNAITAHMMNKGVKRNYKNECTLTLTDTNIHIDSGLAFFENGATITIDDDGIDLVMGDSTETQYVYLFFNDTINVGGARCTVEYPSGDFVMLGSITDGVLTQDRTFAYLNADVKGTNEVVTLTLEPIIISDEKNDGHVWIRYKTDINVTGFNKLCFFIPPEYMNWSSSGIDYTNEFSGIFDIKNKRLIMAVYEGHSNYGSDAIRVWPYIEDTAQTWYIKDGMFFIDLDVTYIHNLNYSPYPPIIIELYGGAEE